MLFARTTPLGDCAPSRQGLRQNLAEDGCQMLPFRLLMSTLGLGASLRFGKGKSTLSMLKASGGIADSPVTEIQSRPRQRPGLPDCLPNVTWPPGASTDRQPFKPRTTLWRLLIGAEAGLDTKVIGMSPLGARP